MLLSSSAATFKMRRKVLQASDVDQSGSGDELAPAQCPHTPAHPPAVGFLLLHIMTTALRPSPDAQYMASFGAMEGPEDEDGAVSVAASMKDEWSNSPLGYTMATMRGTSIIEMMLSSYMSCPKQSMSSVSAPAEPARNHVGEWFLQSKTPFFCEVQQDIKAHKMSAQTGIPPPVICGRC